VDRGEVTYEFTENSCTGNLRLYETYEFTEIGFEDFVF
jgi:hypothetical protein